MKVWEEWEFLGYYWNKNKQIKYTHTDFCNPNYVFKMLTFVWQNRQPTSKITYLFAYYLLVCHYGIGCASIRYVKWKLYKCLYTNVNSVDQLYRYYTLYIIYLAKTPEHEKCAEAGPKRCYSGQEPELFA